MSQFFNGSGYFILMLGIWVGFVTWTLVLSGKKHRETKLWVVAAVIGNALAPLALLFFGDLETMEPEARARSLRKERIVSLLLIIISLAVGLEKMIGDPVAMVVRGWAGLPTPTSELTRADRALDEGNIKSFKIIMNAALRRWPKDPSLKDRAISFYQREIACIKKNDRNTIRRNPEKYGSIRNVA